MAGLGLQPAGSAGDESQREAAYNRSACTECQRRKQKCNREWPCDRCQRRKIAHECRYNYASPGIDPSGLDLTENLKRTQEEHASRASAGAEAEAEEEDAGFDALANRLYATLGIDHGANEKPAPKQDFVNVNSSPQMQRVLKLLPRRQSMDILMQHFFGDINYHYYIIYPPVFLQDYHTWWERRPGKRPLSLQYTCLLAIICACALQHVEPVSEQAFERELGDKLDVVSDQLHAAVRELASVIPVGHYHILNVQRLLHSCYWYKAEAKFLEAWHVLSAAIMEARELGYHKAPPPGTVSDFDLEMRRRLWCILDTWDWQISSGLSRPKIIDRADCDAELPQLTLEGHIVSPLLHMKMQSRLTRQLASRFSAPKNIIAPAEVQEYKVIIEDWVDQFPPEYAFENPDTSKDDKCPWLFAQRFYVYTMACLLILNPIRHYMVKQYTWESPVEELEVREVGIWYSLKLMKTLRLWVDKVYNRDGRLHFIIFSIFDTAAMLCTAVLKDAERTIVNREDISLAIGDAADMLKKLNTISKTAKTSYDILERLIRRLPEAVPRNDPGRQVKRAKMVQTARSAASASSSSSAGTESWSVSPPAPPAHGSVSTASPLQSLPVAAPQPQSEQPTTATATSPESRVSRQGQPHAAGTMAPAAPMPVLAGNMAGPGPTVPSTQQYGYHGHEYLQQQTLQQQHQLHLKPEQHGTRVDYLPMSGSHPAAHAGGYMPAPHPGHYAAQPLWYSSTGTHLGAQSLAPSFSVPHETTGVVDGDAYRQQQVLVADPGPDFNIENLSDTQLGDLAPLWSWHSGNLDFANMPPARAPGYPGGV